MIASSVSHVSPAREPLGSSRLAVFLVLVFAFVLRLIASTPSAIGSDLAVAYYPAALDLAQLGASPWDVWQAWYVRLGVIVPLAMAYGLTGSVEAATPIAALPFSVLQVLMVFLVGRLLFGGAVAILAAFLEAVYPVSVLYGAQPLPDTPMAFWVTASVFCFLFARERSRSLFYLAAGVCLGLAYSAKITGLFAVPVLLGFALLDRRGYLARHLLLVACGALAVLALETLALSLLVGEPTMRIFNLFTVSSGIVEKGLHPVSWSRYVPGFFSGLLWPFDHGFVYHGLMGWAAAVAAWYLIMRTAADKRVHIILLWWLGFILLMNFACVGFSQPIVPKIQMRYLAVATPPAALIIAIFLRAISANPRRLVLAGLVGTCLFCSAAVYSTMQPHDAGYRHLYNVIRNEGAPSSVIFFQQHIFARYVRLAVGEERDCRVVASGHELDMASAGDLATLVIDSYHPPESLPAHYLDELGGPEWEAISEWQSSPGFMADLLEAMHIEVSKGFAKQVTVFKRISSVHESVVKRTSRS